MMPGVDPRAMKAAMKKMGIKQEEINASEVIIKAEGKEIVISSPNVVKVNMMGQTSFQISGDLEEREAKAEITEEDVKTVSEQAGVSEEDARKALEDAGGDLAAAILSLKEG